MPEADKDNLYIKVIIDEYVNMASAMAENTE